MKTIAITAAALAATLAIAPAQAQDLRVQVDYGDLAIGSDAGAAALAERIEANVQRACVRSVGVRDLNSAATCREGLIAEAVDQLNAKGATQAAASLSRKG